MVFFFTSGSSTNKYKGNGMLFADTPYNGVSPFSLYGEEKVIPVHLVLWWALYNSVLLDNGAAPIIGTQYTLVQENNLSDIFVRQNILRRQSKRNFCVAA